MLFHDSSHYSNAAMIFVKESQLYMLNSINLDSLQLLKDIKEQVSSHAEPDELGLVEGLRNLPCEDSIHRADHHQEYWVAEK